MFKKLLVLSLGLTVFFNVWAEDLEESKAKYNSFDEEGKAEIRKNIKESGWIKEFTGQEFDYYVHYDYVKTQSYGLIEAWIKQVVVNDLTKDGLSLGDYSMLQYRFNCNDGTYKLASYTQYNNKTGKVINSYTYPSYDTFKSVVPETVGEALLKSTCLINHVKTH